MPVSVFYKFFAENNCSVRVDSAQCNDLLFFFMKHGSCPEFLSYSRRKVMCAFFFSQNHSKTLTAYPSKYIGYPLRNITTSIVFIFFPCHILQRSASIA